MIGRGLVDETHHIGGAAPGNVRTVAAMVAAGSAGTAHAGRSSTSSTSSTTDGRSCSRSSGEGGSGGAAAGPPQDHMELHGLAGPFQRAAVMASTDICNGIPGDASKTRVFWYTHPRAKPVFTDYLRVPAEYTESVLLTFPA